MLLLRCYRGFHLRLSMKTAMIIHEVCLEGFYGRLFQMLAVKPATCEGQCEIITFDGITQWQVTAMDVQVPRKPFTKWIHLAHAVLVLRRGPAKWGTGPGPNTKVIALNDSVA